MLPVREPPAKRNEYTLQPGETLRLRFSLKECCAGEVKKALQIHADVGDPVQIDVRGRLRDAVVIAPRSCIFGRLPWNTGGQEELTLRSADGQPFEVLGLESPIPERRCAFAWEPVEEAEPARSVWRLLASARPEASFEGADVLSSVRIRVRLEDRELLIPLTVAASFAPAITLADPQAAPKANRRPEVLDFGLVRGFPAQRTMFVECAAGLPMQELLSFASDSGAAVEYEIEELEAGRRWQVEVSIAEAPLLRFFTGTITARFRDLEYGPVLKFQGIRRAP